MKKISRVDAFAGMDEIDHKVMEQELQSIFESDQRNEREQTQQFYLDEENFIVLDVLWEDTVVQTLRFKNKGVLTEEGKKAIGGGK